MATDSYVFAGIAGYVGRPNEEGKVGVFRRPSKSAASGSTFFPTSKPTPSWCTRPTLTSYWRAPAKASTFPPITARLSSAPNFPDKVQTWSFLVDRRDPRRIIAGVSPVNFYESRDMGANWEALPDSGIQEREQCTFRHRVMRMVQHPTRPDEIFAALEVNGVVHSTDFGRTWTDRSEHLIELSKLPHLKSAIITKNEAEGMLDGHAITMSPADPDAVVLACRMGLFKSTDKGNSWQDMELKRFSPVTYGRDVKVAAQDAKTVYAALSVAAASHDGGVYRSKDAGKTWSRFDKVQVHGTIMSIGLNDRDPDEVYIGARYQGEVFGTRDGGATWTPLPIPGPVKDIYCVTCG